MRWTVAVVLVAGLVATCAPAAAETDLEGTLSDARSSAEKAAEGALGLVQPPMHIQGSGSPSPAIPPQSPSAPADASGVASRARDAESAFTATTAASAPTPANAPSDAIPEGILASLPEPTAPSADAPEPELDPCMGPGSESVTGVAHLPHLGGDATCPRHEIERQEMGHPTTAQRPSDSDSAGRANGGISEPGSSLASPQGHETDRATPAFTTTQRGVGMFGRDGPGLGPLSPAALPGLVATLAAGLALLAVALYRRLSAEATSNQAQRARILECVLARPGSSVTELARATGLHPTTVRYHLRLLQEFHAVALRRDGRTLRVFQNGGTFPPEEQGKRAAAMRSGAQRILASLPAEGAPAPALARAVGVSRQAIHKQLPALAAAGLLRLERRGSAVWAFPMLQGRDKRGLDDGLRLSGLSSNVRHAPSSPIEK